MIKNLLSRYNLRYPRSLVYMLQASEYKIRDYLLWYHRTRDFKNVEFRKHFVRTPKAVLLLVISWISVVFIIALAVYIFAVEAKADKYILSLGVLFLLPYFLAYLIIIPLLAFEVFIQRPIEYMIIRTARQKLKAHNALKIGVAGSFGKTSMREILKTVLSEGKKVAAPPHSYNTLLGISKFIKTLKGNEEVLIFEFGEYYPGDIRKLCSLVMPEIGFITGVNEAHLDKFKSLDRTVKEIFELADYLGEKTVYVNGDSRVALNHLRPGDIVYRRSGLIGWKVENARTDLTGTCFTLVGNDDAKIELKSALLGLHQIGPLAAVFDLAVKLGFSLGQIKAGVSKTKPFDHRLEAKTDSTGITILDDSYNGNPDGVQAVIEFLASLKANRRFYVTPGLVEMGARREEIHREIGRQLAKAGIEKVVLIRNSVTAYIAEGLKEADYGGEMIWFDNAPEAFAALPHLTVKDDVVLLQNDWPDQYR